MRLPTVLGSTIRDRAKRQAHLQEKLVQRSAGTEEMDKTVCEESTAPTVSQLMELRMTRRAALTGIAAVGAYALFGCATRATEINGSSLTFIESGRFLDETHHVSPGYKVTAVIRWGDPLHTTAPAFNPQAQTAAAQERQFGANNDFIAYMPLPRGSANSRRGLLCVNNEYTTPQLMWPGYTDEGYAKNITREQCETEMAAQGHSIVEIENSDGVWKINRGSAYNRRISALSTVMRVSGPAAGHPRMKTQADTTGARVIGTFGNCAGGTTPWGTVLSAEENIQNYFTGNPGIGREAAAWKRYGIHGRGRQPWGVRFDRFNLDREPHEPNRFGWVVEIDPYDPQSVPVKRTALGRFKHECATTALSHDARVAVYSGDDERMEYVYKFVTQGRYDAQQPAANRDLLDHGTLYVARFEADGRMHWLPLIFGQVMIDARRAADLLGATRMDRPEDVEANPVTGRIYVVCTYNESRKPAEVDAANPRGPNRVGHIIEIVPPMVNGKPDHAAVECHWEFFLLGGDPKNSEHGARYHGAISDNGWVAAPDNVAFDRHGRIWITTDGQSSAAGFADSVYAAETSGPRRGVTRCLFSAPRGAETTGPAFTPDGKTLFISIQHPGSEKGSTIDRPSTRWPDFRPDMPPRPSVVAITHAEGKDIGS
jgi:uncharacterized protein